MGGNTDITASTAFSEWLRTQLRARRMTQRQLADQAGLSHATVSRLLSGEHVPSLTTATKLARALRELGDETDAARYFTFVVTKDPTARVEQALRADGSLSEADVRQVTHYYLNLRLRGPRTHRSQ